MALTTRPITLALWLSFFAAQWTTAQDVAPTNATNSHPAAQFALETMLEGMETHANINPLTNSAGLQGSSSQIQDINPAGPLFLTNPSSVGSLKSGSIAYLSCEPGDYTGAINAQRTINLAVSNRPYAIVLYSIYAESCTFTPSDGFQYSSMYTMLSANSSEAIIDGLQKNNPPNPQTSIHTVSNSSSGNGDNDNNNLLGHSPTTAVAMIILYSITGVITALFLLIIIVGAIRAHRHPERYGPRRVIGRPRQSRAKGIARAMLETIPIVKFGDKEEDKPPETSRDVELADAPHANTPENVQRRSGEVMTSDPAASTGDGPDEVRTEAAAGTALKREGGASSANDSDNGLVCSVCTEDFVKGQDVRVLPCKHTFHPECIDPWLLNVSGTCPLCRVDLVPTASHTSNPDDDSLGNPTETAPPDVTTTSPTEAPTTETTARRNRRSRILHTLNIGRMRQATPEERMAALRTLRSENRDQPADAGHEAGSSTMNRFSRRFSRAFGGSRPQSGVVSQGSRPVSGVPDGPVESETPGVDSRREGTFPG